MAKLDLRTLSAPLEALQADVKAAYSRLDSTWEAITKQLRKLSIPAPVSVTFDTEENSGDSLALEFMKWKGEKRICISSYSYCHDEFGVSHRRDSVTPFEEWSAEQRIEMLEHVPELFAEAVKVTKAFLKKIPD